MVRKFTHLGYTIARALFPGTIPLGLPRGIFSLDSLVREGAIHGRIVCDCQRLPKFPEDSMVRRCGMKQDDYQPWPIFWGQLSGIHLVGPTLALMNNQVRLALESLFRPTYYEDPAYRSWRRPAPTYLDGTWTSLVIPFGKGYYHWLLDALPRLAILEEFPAETRILVPAQLESYQRESLALLGLQDRIRPTPETHLILENYFFSAPTGMTGAMNPYAVNAVRTMVLKKFPSSSGAPRRRFYIPRTGTRMPINSEAICDFFGSIGWEIIRPEKLTFTEQVTLFSQAEAICADHGAALTNLLFAPSDCRVLELFADNFLNACYEVICAAREIKHRYIIFPADDEYRPSADIELLKSTVRDFFT